VVEAGRQSRSPIAERGVAVRPRQRAASSGWGGGGAQRGAIRTDGIHPSAGDLKEERERARVGEWGAVIGVTAPRLAALEETSGSGERRGGDGGGDLTLESARGRVGG